MAITGLILSILSLAIVAILVIWLISFIAYWYGEADTYAISLLLSI